MTTDQATTMLTDWLLPSTAADWKRAACRDDPDKEAWFPFPSQSFGHAREVCARCPIRIPCGRFAAATGQTGVWGGRAYDHGRLVRE